MTAKRSELKRQLLEQARQRPAPRSAGNMGLVGQSSRPASRKVPERFTRFDAHPGYQQMALMRQRAEQIGLKDPFFKVHECTAAATSMIARRP